MISFENIFTLSAISSVLVQKSFDCRSREDSRLQYECKAEAKNCNSYDNSIRGILISPSALCYES